MPQPLYPRERNLVSIVQEVGWALGLLWMGAENPHTIQSIASYYTNFILVLVLV
jgi:hypothetical protein